jgi:hypothetical protein
MITMFVKLVLLHVILALALVMVNVRHAQALHQIITSI